MLHIEVAGKTDVGRVRRKNEDALGAFPEISLFAVADGMGGHQGGAVASELTIESLRRSVVQTAGEDLTPIIDAAGRSSLGGRRLLMALDLANNQVLEASRNNPDLEGMGSAVAAVMLDHRFGQIAIGHVGDTRVYRIRDGRVDQLTEDHTLVQQLVREGRVRPESVRTDPNRHVLTQAVGVAPLMQATVRIEEPRTGDYYLLTSDGVHDVVDRLELLQIIDEAGGNLDRACDRMIALANERGGRDNASVLLLRCDERSASELEDPTIGV